MRALRALEFEIVLFFFTHWRSLAPSRIDHCKERGVFPLLQATALSLLRRTQYWPVHRQQRFEERRLGRLLEHYGIPRGKALRARDQLQARPIMTRDDLQQRFKAALDAVASCQEAAEILLGTTSGTTGTPIRVGITRQMAAHYAILRRRFFEFAGVRPHEPFTYPRTTANPNFCKKDLYIAEDLTALASKSQDLFRTVTERRATSIYAFPSLLALLQEKIARDGISPPPLKAVFSAGEELSPDLRSRLQRAFGAPVYNFYASIELSSIAQECPAQNGLHISPEFHVIELLSPAGEPVAGGDWGRMVITPLDPHLVPILRYDTGDIGRYLEGPCPCGRTLPRVQIRGRNFEVIPTAHGPLHPYAFKELLDRFDKRLDKIRQFQLIVEKGGAMLALAIVPTERFSKDDLRELERLCRWFLKGDIGFEIRLVEVLERKGLKTPYLLRRDQ